jgi:hypothetical protein
MNVFKGVKVRDWVISKQKITNASGKICWCSLSFEKHCQVPERFTTKYSTFYAANMTPRTFILITNHYFSLGNFRYGSRSHYRDRTGVDFILRHFNIILRINAYR